MAVPQQARQISLQDNSIMRNAAISAAEEGRPLYVAQLGVGNCKLWVKSGPISYVVSDVGPPNITPIHSKFCQTTTHPPLRAPGDNGEPCEEAGKKPFLVWPVAGPEM